MHRVFGRLKKFLREERRDECAQNHNSHQDRVLSLIDDLVLESEQRRDGAKGQAGRHQQGGVSSFAPVHVMQPRQRPDTRNFRQHFQKKQSSHNRERRPECRQRNVEPGFNEVEWRKHREGDAAHSINQCFVAEKNSCDHQANQVGRQYRFAFRAGGEAAKKKQNKKDKLYFRFALILPMAVSLKPPSIIKCGFRKVGEIVDPENNLVWRWERGSTITSLSARRLCHVERSRDISHGCERQRGSEKQREIPPLRSE